MNIRTKVITTFSTATICIGLFSLALARDRVRTPHEKELDKLLMTYVQRGNADKVTELLAQGASPNASNNSKMSVLQYAAKDDRLDIVKLLITAGADLNSQDKYGLTPLSEAASNRTTLVLQELLKLGAIPDNKALERACTSGLKETVLLLLKAGVEPNYGMVSAAQAGRVELLKLFLKEGADVNTKSPDGTTALHTAALQGGFKTVKFLLEQGADVNVTSKKSDTPLHMAIVGDCNPRTIKLLIDSGAKVNIANNEGMTPVRLAASRGNKQVYDLLLAANDGVEPKPQRNPNGSMSQQSVSTSELIDQLLQTDDRKKQLAAQQQLITRGKQAIPDVVKKIESGTPLAKFAGFFAALGPDSATALPLLQEALADKEQVWVVTNILARIRPGFISELPQDIQDRGAAAYYQAILDPKNETAYLLVRYFPGFFGKSSEPYLLKLLQHENPGWRAKAAEHMARVPFKSDDLREELIELLKGELNLYLLQRVARGLSNPYFHSPKAKTALEKCRDFYQGQKTNWSSKTGGEREKARAKQNEIDQLMRELDRAISSYQIKGDG